MNVLFVIPEYSEAAGGIGSFYKVLLPRLISLGVKVTAIVGSSVSEGPEDYCDQGVVICKANREKYHRLKSCFPDLAIAPDLTSHLAAAWTIWEQTKGGEGYDIVECTDWGLLFVPWLLEPSAPPLVVRLHGSDGQIFLHDPNSCSPLCGHLFQLIETAMLQRARLLTTCSKSNQKNWEVQLKRKVFYCPPPNDITPPINKRHRITGRGLVVGRVQRWKGTATLCRALQILGAEAPTVDWVGRSVITQATGLSHTTELEYDFPDIWGTRIVHHPQEPRDRIAQRQANSDFVLVPSDWDVYNLTAVEAMAQQAVLICSTGAGASELIEHEVNGFLFQAGDANALAMTIRQVQSLTPDKRRKVGKAAHATVTYQLSPDRIARLTLEHYELALETTAYSKIEQDLLRNALSPTNPSDNGKNALHRNLDRINLKLLLNHVRARLQQKLFGGFFG